MGNYLKYLYLYRPNTYIFLWNIRISTCMILGINSIVDKIVDEYKQFLPIVGEYVKITWLPNSKKAPHDDNFLIGTEGKIIYKRKDCSIDILTIDNSIVVISEPYKFEYL